MHTFSTSIKAERGYYPGQTSYYTGTVVYWRRREVWMYQRSFVHEAKMREWMAAKKKHLELSGPEPAQAPEYWKGRHAALLAQPAAE